MSQRFLVEMSQRFLVVCCVVFAIVEKIHGGDSGVVGWLVAAAGWMAASEEKWQPKT